MARATLSAKDQLSYILHSGPRQSTLFSPLNGIEILASTTLSIATIARTNSVEYYQPKELLMVVIAKNDVKASRSSTLFEIGTKGLEFRQASTCRSTILNPSNVRIIFDSWSTHFGCCLAT